MTEMSWTVYHIGGKLPAGKLDELKKFAEDFEEHDSSEGIKGGEVLVLQGSLNYGNHDDLDEFLQENGLPFHAAWAAVPGAFDSGARWWNPTMGEDIEEGMANDDGEPIVPLGALEMALQQGRTLADLIAELALQSSTVVPPLELIGDAEACKGCDNPAPKCATDPCEFVRGKEIGKAVRAAMGELPEPHEPEHQRDPDEIEDPEAEGRALGRMATIVELYDEPEDVSAVADLLSDIRHYCNANNFDFDSACRVSEMHFDAERHDVDEAA